MTECTTRVHLWEYAPSPHLGNVLKGMADRGYRVRYVVRSETYAHREAEGWVKPAFPGVEILLADDAEAIHEVIAEANHVDVHICVGLRANDFVREVVAALRAADHRFLVFMETIDERSRFRLLKRLLYRLLLWRNRGRLEGVLAAGASTPVWVAARGMPPERIFDFAYFLPTAAIPVDGPRSDDCFRLLFVGSLVAQKRVHLVIESLPELPAHVVLEVVGDGPLRAELETLAASFAPGRVTFYGTRPMPEIAGLMAGADCLVLPSEHDGWGAVVSEAMITGTPVVCSDRCGASAVVRASGQGAVFETFTPGACTAAIRSQVMVASSAKNRIVLAEWAACLTEPAGAAYLDAIIDHLRNDGARPVPPWHVASLLSGSKT